MPAPASLAGLPKPILFGLYGALGGLLGAVLLGEAAWQALKPPLAVSPPQVAVGASAVVKVYPGTENTLFVRIARERFTEPVTVTFGNLPSGVTIPSVTIPPDATDKQVTVTAAVDAKVGTTKGVSVTAAAPSGTPTATTTLDLDVTLPPPALAIAVPSKLVVYTRGEGKFSAVIDRRSYDGEVAIRVENLPSGITALPAVIPTGEREAEVTLKATIDIPLTAAKLTVVAEATPAGLKAASIADPAGLAASAVTSIDVVVPPIAPVDVVFVLDVTASMQWALDDLKKGILKFSDALSKAQLSYRLGLVTFQDITNPGEKVEVVTFGDSPFTSDGNAYRDKVGQLKAEGGGDIPESSLEGMSAAANLWDEEKKAQDVKRSRTKMLLLITDAPPKVLRGNVDAEVRKVAAIVKEKGIESVNVVADKLDEKTYKPLQEAGTLAGKGKFFYIQDLIRNEEGFETLLNDFGRDVAAVALSRTTDARPKIEAPASPEVGRSAALAASATPEAPSIKGVQASGQFAAGTEGRLILAIGVWTGAIAALLCLALLSGQYHYLRGQFPPALRAIAGFGGGFVVGIVGGAAGQGLYLMAPDSAALGNVFREFGWAILGGLAGLGLSLFIPNLKGIYGLAGGAIGGAVGGLGYMGASSVAGDLIGRVSGGLIVGFFIGLMVALVEAAFRSAWLEVRFGARETIKVNLGPEPVKIGGDAKMCTVWARGAAPLALRFFIRDGKVICDDAIMKRESAVTDGYAKEVGNVTVTVRTGTGSGTAAAPTPARVASSPKPAASAPPKPAASAPPKPPVADDDLDFLPMPIGPPATVPAQAPVSLSPQKPSMPVSGPSKPSIPSIPAIPSRPLSPAVPDPPAVSAKPSSPAMLAVSKPSPPGVPPKPASPPSKPAAPPVPTSTKPTAPPTPPKSAFPPPPPPALAAKHPDACPGCGRINAGKPKTRYCMVCDQTY